MRIEYLSKGKPKRLMDQHGKAYESGISKSPAAELTVSAEKVFDDDVANHSFHGGPDRVLCVYPYEHYNVWKEEFGKELQHAAFGENLTLSGLTEKEVCIGDQYEIGTVLAEISQGRYPCATINRHTGINQLLSRVIETGYTGYFFRVIRPGVIRNTDCIQLIKRTTSISVADIHHTFFHNRRDAAAIQKILEVQQLAEDWKGKLRALSKRLED
ncbi:MOSC domain-containing protein [Metabacillus sp. 113a]|uniref:MOSC domain-containing protein n=1 Tax=Metabacillus sp. 113a TaxID=3404706 RepID=UPI003CFB7DB1